MLTADQRAWLCQVSPFIERVVAQQPEALEVLQNGASITAAESYLPLLQDALANCADEASAQHQLRWFRQRWYAEIAAADLLGRLPMEQALHHLTASADAFIIAAKQWLMPRFTERFGSPRDEFGEVQQLAVIGMGKLGGGELNFSSDIDLIFCYAQQGETDHPRKPIENGVFFTRLAQALVALLDTVTADGRVFRVDLRLRPFGQSGPLVASFAALEYYYQEQGRDWERYAMVKARLIGAKEQQQQELHSLLRPFVYRRYIDFSAIDSLRTMKQLITQESKRLGVQHNIKLGAGGIREIEFIAQVFQLIRGGQQRQLQTQSLYRAYAAIAEFELLSESSVKELLESYAYLRKLEHVLQQIDDQQTQTLPTDELNQRRVAQAMGTDWTSLVARVQQVMAQVHAQFRDVIGNEVAEEEEIGPLQLLWQDMIDDDTALEILHEQGLSNPAAMTAWQQIQQFRQDLRKRGSGPRGRKAMARLLPILLQRTFSSEQPLLLLERLLQLLKKISSRTAYIELLLENQGAREQLLKLCGASQWLSNHLANYPLLLDELIVPQQLYQLPDYQQYPQLLDEYLLRIPEHEHDLEAQMNALRQARQVLQLKVAAADITGALALMRVSDHLSYLAEAMIGRVVALAWQQLVEKHGAPPGRDITDTGFAVMAYGKLGGLELGYGSDLDLVFISDADYNLETNGARPLEVQQFYLRLAQRVLHIFTTKTMIGTLYDVDLRLRPDGKSGLMVTRLSTYASYLQQEAWTWELQALVRARPVYGEASIQQKLRDTRCELLQRRRDDDLLRQEVLQMRDKMREHLLRSNAEHFDLKQGVGGITDIEFLVQYLVLRFSHQHPQLTTYTDNIRILEQAAACQVLSAHEAQQLIDAYLVYRAEVHRLALDNYPALSNKAFKIERAAVQQLWQQFFNDTDQGHLG